MCKGTKNLNVTTINCFIFAGLIPCTVSGGS